MIDDLILHPRSKELAAKIAANLPHGLIIDGATGIGVTALAHAIAAMNGVTPFIIQPKKKLKGEFVINPEDGSVIIEDIRKLYQQTRTKQPNKQIYIIDTGEKSLTHGAQNAFLKLLEEPRSGVHFIITTHQFDQLLPTIVSRSQRLPLMPVTAQQTRDLIASLGVTDETKQTRLAFVGLGRPALVKRLASDENLYDNRVTIMKDAKTMISGKEFDRITTIHRYRDNRPDSLTLIDDMNHQLRTVLKNQPEPRLVKDIEKNLEIRGKIASGGNIRLQLTSVAL